jgi:hypothetical protein
MSDTREIEKRRCERQPGLFGAALTICTVKMTDGFCTPRNVDSCKCWDIAATAMEATGLSARAVSWVFHNAKRIEQEAERNAGIAPSPQPVGEIARDQIVDALQTAWDDWAQDTGCYPDCFKITRGPMLWADFKVSNFAEHVAMHLNAARPTVKESLPVAPAFDEEAERVKFESWRLSKGVEPVRHPLHEWEYRYSSEQAAWISWLSRARIAADEQAGMRERVRAETIDQAIEAIKGEQLIEPADTEDDRAYDDAIGDALDVVRAMRSPSHNAALAGKPSGGK